MRKPSALIALGLALLLAGCAGTTPPTEPPSSTPTPALGTPTPEPTFRHGVQGLISDLTDAGAKAVVSSSFNGEPLAVEGLVVCVNAEEVRVYAFSSEQERAAVSGRIDPSDPSNVGTAIIEWNGSPKFWARDRILVLYLDDDQETIELLTGLMGEPFASGRGRGQPLRNSCA